MSRRSRSLLIAGFVCLGQVIPAWAGEEGNGLVSQLAISPAEAPLPVQEISPAPVPAAPIDLTAVQDDLWVRIRHGFAMTDLNDDLVLYYQQWYQNRPEGLRRMVERARPFMHYIVGEIEARGMPTELALLPMVESAFNPMAYSPAHASGLWQFIPATGKRFNLQQNWWHDQRRDIIASTGAALDYLQTIYDMHGDWHLALASYNWGEGAVKRAVDRNSAAGLATDYGSLRMPEETRHYVPKLQALKNIFSNPVLMVRLQIPGLDNTPSIATLEVDKPIDVKTAARLANMPVQEFVALNPSHNRPVIKPDSAVVLPADKLDLFERNLRQHDGPLTQWESYTLKPGERLDRLAPRFGITLADLMRVNGLRGQTRLPSGTTVLVPAGNGTGSLAALGEGIRLPDPPPPRLPVIKGREKATKALAVGKATHSAAKGLAGKTGAKDRPGVSKAVAAPKGKGPVKGTPKTGGKSAAKPPVNAKAASPAKKTPHH